MKKVFLSLCFCSSIFWSFSQVGIGNTNPDASSILDITATDKGILLPRVALVNVTTTMLDGANTAATGLFIYNTNAAVTGGNGVGYYYFNGTIWEKITTSATNSDDNDWHEEGTTTSPDNINDDMFTQGNVAIGQTSALYRLDVNESNGLRGINVQISGNSNNSVYGNYIYNSNTGSGQHFGTYNLLQGAGSGLHYGNYQSVASTGTGSHYGSFNWLTGSGAGMQYGSYQDIANSGNNAHYGSYNLLRGTGTGSHNGSFNFLSGTGSGSQFGSTQSISNTGNGNHYGSWNFLAGNGNGDQFGSRQQINNSGSGIHYGIYNTLIGSGTGVQYASYNHISNNSGSLLFGTYNFITGNNPNTIEGTTNYITNYGNGDHYGIFNELDGSGSGDQYGNRNNIGNTYSGTHYGTFNNMTGTGTGIHYGAYNDLSGTGTGEQYGIYTEITNTGNATHYGAYNFLSGTGTGQQFGTYNLIDNSNNNNHFGTRNFVGGSGIGFHYGIYNRVGGIGEGNQYGSYQDIANSGNGAHFGTYNYLFSNGTGDKTGIYSLIPPSAGGQHYGVYSVVLKSGSYAGYFLGNVSIGTALGDSYILPVSRGTANQVIQTDGSGNLGWVNTSTIGDDLGNHGATTTLDLNSNQINEVLRINMLPQSNYDKYRLYNNAITTIGMHDNMTYGFLNNDWAMTFTVQEDADRGWIWRDINDAQSDGAMSLTADGRLFLKSHLRVDTNTLSVDATNNRVGIGTTAPGYALDVISRARIRNGNGTSGIWYADGAVDRQFAGVQTHSATGTLQKWGIWNNSAWRFIVQGNGNVGIGTTAPTDRFHVNGGRVEFTGTTDASGTVGSGVLEIANSLRLDANEVITNTNATLFLQNDNNGDLRVDGNTFAVDASLNRIGLGLTNPSYQLHLTLNSAAKPISNAWIVFSDVQLKKNVRPFTDGLELIKQINPVWFTYNGIAGMPNETGVGTLAQEFQKIAPYMVKPWEYTSEDGSTSESYLGIDYGPLNFVMVNAIQEQQELIETQNSKIKSLEQQLKQQQQEINEIKLLIKK